MYLKYNAAPSRTLFSWVIIGAVPFIYEDSHPYVESLYYLEQRLLRQNGLNFDQNYPGPRLPLDEWGTTAD
jgi:hypothetical protein